jgi:hypothetical protein
MNSKEQLTVPYKRHNTTKQIALKFQVKITENPSQEYPFLAFSKWLTARKYQQNKEKSP